MSSSPSADLAPCLACGNNPCSHRLVYFSETTAVVGTYFEGLISFIPAQWLYVLVSWFEYSALLWMKFMGGLALVDEVPGFDRALVLYEEAKKRGITMKTARLMGKNLDYYFATLPNGVQIVFQGLPKMLVAPAPSHAWLDDKALFKKHVKKAGVPVADGGTAWTLSRALKIFDGLRKPVIVKPRQGSRGRHTSTWVKTREELTEAFFSARELCGCVLIEEQFSGSVYRGTIVDGEVAGILAGDHPRVIGDGVSSIRVLIEKKNATRPTRVGEVKITDKLKAFLLRTGYTLETVLPAGIDIDLSEKIGLSYGGDAREVTPETHPKIIEYVRRAGTVVGDPIVGFDFIIPRIDQDPDTQTWGFIECNGHPFINLHHDPREGAPVNVAGKVWEYALRECAKKPNKKRWICLY